MSGADPVSTALHPLDVVVLLGYLAGVSWLGVKLAGKSDSADRFFRGGGIPWPAVAASMIATAVSAVTFIAVPAVVFRDDGNFTYLQFGLVAGLLSRLVVAGVLVPAYFRESVLSPYDFMANQLGREARWVTTAMFSLMGVLGQAARVYLTGLVLVVMLHGPLSSLAGVVGLGESASAMLAIAVAGVSVVAIVWTLLGGVATVIWTDAMLLAVFVLGGLVALGTVAAGIDGGLGHVFASGWESGKFRLFDLALAPEFTRPYTLWAAVIAVTFGNIGAYGTDQLLAQRIFACRSQRDAKKAVLASYLGELFAALMLLVGVALWVFYDTHPGRLPAAAEADADQVFPAFVLAEVPPGLAGLILAGVFAAALSSLTSILAALAQTTTALLPDAATGPSGLRRARWLVALWGVVLAGAAVGAGWYVDHQEAAGNDVPLLDLALGLSSYVIGGLLAAFILSWLPLGINARGLLFSAPLSVVCVWAARFHGDGPFWVCVAVGSAFVLAWVAVSAAGAPALRGARLLRLPVVLLAAATPLLIERLLVFGVNDAGPITLAWPWYAPLAGLVAGVYGWAMADPRTVDRIGPERPRSAAPAAAIALGAAALLTAGCCCGYGAPDRNLTREVAESEVTGVWRLTDRSLRHLIDDGLKIDPDHPHTVTFFGDGRLAFRSVLGRPHSKLSPAESLDASGRWVLDHGVIGREVTTKKANALGLRLDIESAFNGTSLSFTEASGRLVLWDWYGDPDAWEFLEYERIADAPPAPTVAP